MGDAKQWARVLPFDRQRQTVCGMHTHDAWLIRDVLARVGADKIRVYLADYEAAGAGYVGLYDRTVIGRAFAHNARRVREGWSA